jgi:acylphosphatase
VSAALHVLVDGRVQGVGFRWFVREEATRLGLAGWVRNLPDGSVEVCAAGDVASLDAFRTALARGPAGARVAAVTDVPTGAPSPTGAFEIRRD